jgi:zinc and cadmium transporter
MPIVLLAYYCALVLVASIVGGMIPMWITLTHRRMELAVSFVAGVMLGVGVMIMLPHAIVDAAGRTGAVTHSNILGVMTALLAGMLVMFLIERFFSFHHHGVPEDAQIENERHADCAHDDSHGAHAPHHDITWSGAVVGMTLHSIVDGVALAASVQHGDDTSLLAGFGTFLVIFLHKPFDSLTIGMLMARGHRSAVWRHVVNGLFALAIPLGVILFYFLKHRSTDGAVGGNLFIAHALAFSAGTFLCISLSDLLPELQFHQHDRVKLTVALLLGLFVAYVAARAEATTHASHEHARVGGTLRASKVEQSESDLAQWQRSSSGAL